MTSTAAAGGPETQERALRTWVRWMARPIDACQRHAQQSADTQHRVLRQLWCVSLALTCLVDLAQYALVERTAAKYPSLLFAVAPVPVLLAAASFFMMRFALTLFRIRLSVSRLLTFHTAFAIAYLPLMQLAGFYPARNTLVVLQQAKRDGLDRIEAFRVVGRHLMELSKADHSAWMGGASLLNTLVFVAATLLTTFYARMVRADAQVTLVRAISALTFGGMLASGAAFVFVGLFYLLAYAIVE